MYFTERGDSLPALMSAIKQKYGGNAQILEQKSVPKKGISGMLGNHLYEITGFFPGAQARDDLLLRDGASYQGGTSYQDGPSSQNAAPSQNGAATSLPAPELRAAIEEVRSEARGNTPPADRRARRGAASASASASARPLTPASAAASNEKIERRLNQLHKKLDLFMQKSGLALHSLTSPGFLSSAAASASPDSTLPASAPGSTLLASIPRASYPELCAIEQALLENDFGYSFTQTLMQQARRFFTIEQLRQIKKSHAQVMEWIAERIRIASWDQIHNGRIHILIGPTGVGKTTTLAKIAKLLAFGNGTKRIANIGLLTIDNYRLAAKEQLDGYGRSMGTPVKLVRNANELKSELALHERDRHILIDTIGRSPHESASLGGMRQLIRHCGKEATCSLVISATTKRTDLELIKKHYQPFDFRSVIVTKLDETDTVGNVISAFADDETPFVYFTHGQKVPLDIHNASREALLVKIFGFNVNKSHYRGSNMPIG